MPAMNVRTRAYGVVPVRAVADGWRFLILRAYRLWDFPKGLPEAGETPLASARREALEEAGLDDLELRWGEVFAETAPYSRGKVARYYLAATGHEAITLPVNPELGRPEHHEARWVGAEEAAELLPARLQPVLAWARGQLDGGSDGRP